MDILITGSAGYIGGLLVEKFSKENDVKNIFCIDLLPQPERFSGNGKLHWIQADLAEKKWYDRIPAHAKLDAVIHCAFKIRNPYGKTAATEENNVHACRNVFSFAFERGTDKLVYLASVAAYSPRPENIGRLITEDEPLREKENPYGYQKALTEEVLQKLIAEKKPKTKTFILRLNSVTGPVGQSMTSKFGLITFLRQLLPFVIEAGPHWARQFVHEDDVVQIIFNITMKHVGTSSANPEIFNVAPPRFLTAKEMGRVLDKMTLRVPGWLIKPLFAASWHLTHGKIPTPPESSKGLIYPINVDGSKVERAGIHKYRHTAEGALLGRSAH